MISLRYAMVVSASLGGLGYWLGLENKSDLKLKLKKSFSLAPSDSDSKIDLHSAHNREYPSWYRFLPVAGTILAASSVDANLPVPSSSSAGVSPNNRVAEIMSFGFPGLDNVRFYENYVVSYDRRNRNAHWVFEHIKREHCAYGQGVDRNKFNFKEDTSIHPYFRATNADYKGSGYDRGHLAAAANHRHSQKAMDQTFVLSNVSPQVGEGFNRGGWNSLEKYTRALARKNKSVYVCTGPLYLPKKDDNGNLFVKYQVIGSNHVAVPTHFFKVLVVEDEMGQYEMKSFVLPNEALPDNVPLKVFQVPVETIERAAGFLLFENIPKKSFKLINGAKPK